MRSFRPLERPVGSVPVDRLLIILTSIGYSRYYYYLLFSHRFQGYARDVIDVVEDVSGNTVRALLYRGTPENPAFWPRALRDLPFAAGTCFMDSSYISVFMLCIAPASHYALIFSNARFGCDHASNVPKT